MLTCLVTPCTSKQKDKIADVADSLKQLLLNGIQEKLKFFRMPLPLTV